MTFALESDFFKRAFTTLTPFWAADSLSHARIDGTGLSLVDGHQCGDNRKFGHFHSIRSLRHLSHVGPDSRDAQGGSLF